MQELPLDGDESTDVEVLTFKVLIVGEPGVGKTSTVSRYVHGRFSNQYKSTIGVDFALKNVQWNKNLRIDLQMWDLAGQERLGTQIGVYFREACGAIVVYDASREETKAQVAAWKQLLDDKVTHRNEQVKIPCILLANKMDIINPDLNFHDTLEINALAEQLGFSKGFATSMKLGFGLDVAMNHLITDMLFNYREAQRLMANGQTDIGLDLRDPVDPPTRSGCYC